MSNLRILNESTEEEVVLDFLQKAIKNTEWENRVFLAGGAVRDQIMGKKAKDLDFVINGNINAGLDFSIWLAKLLKNYKEDSNPVIFPKYGTAKLSLDRNNANLPPIELEFVAPRKEEYDGKSRKPEVVGGELKDDVYRRDLTINSLLRNVSTNEVIDMSGMGIEDIKNGIIRTTSDANIIFKDDPLRMLRAIRFAVKYDFKFAPKTLQQIRDNSEKINNISAERIKDELEKILLTNKPSEGIRLLKITHLLKHILPEFNDAIGMKQNKFHKDDVFKHSMDVLSKTPSNIKTRLMALFHDIGKVLTKSVTPEGSVHFYEHEKVGAGMVKEIMARLKYPNELIDAVANGVKNHMYLKHGGNDSSGLTDKTLRKFMKNVGDNLEYILDVIHADNISHSEHGAMPNQIDNIKRRLETLSKQIDVKKLKLPINGNDVIQHLGLSKPGPIVGQVMLAIEDAYMENPEITREEALKIVDTFKVQNEINEMKKMMNKLK